MIWYYVVNISKVSKDIVGILDMTSQRFIYIYVKAGHMVLTL